MLTALTAWWAREAKSIPRKAYWESRTVRRVADSAKLRDGRSKNRVVMKTGGHPESHAPALPTQVITIDIPVRWYLAHLPSLALLSLFWASPLSGRNLRATPRHACSSDGPTSADSRRLPNYNRH